MSDYELPDLDEEEETDEGWLEYWFVVGGVSEQAQQAIESVDGKVIRLYKPFGYSIPGMYAVCLLYHPDDNDQGFCWHTDDEQKARKLFICSADAHHDLYIYCTDGSVPCFESDTAQLHLVTEAEWFEIADGREEKS